MNWTLTLTFLGMSFRTVQPVFEWLGELSIASTCLRLLLWQVSKLVLEVFWLFMETNVLQWSLWLFVKWLDRFFFCREGRSNWTWMFFRLCRVFFFPTRCQLSLTVAFTFSLFSPPAAPEGHAMEHVVLQLYLHFAVPAHVFFFHSQWRLWRGRHAPWFAFYRTTWLPCLLGVGFLQETSERRWLLVQECLHPLVETKDVMLNIDGKHPRSGALTFFWGNCLKSEQIRRRKQIMWLCYLDCATNLTVR